MGLDMYLVSAKKSTSPCNNMDTVEIGYWRKANAVHNWFVKNVQDGVDDCEYHKVSKEDLKMLRDTCIKVFDSIKLVSGKVIGGYLIKNDETVPQYIDGKVIEDVSVCEDLLPTLKGFFFGNTEYNEWYYQDVKNTLEIITRVLNETDFDEEQVYYYSSW